MRRREPRPRQLRPGGRWLRIIGLKVRSLGFGLTLRICGFGLCLGCRDRVWDLMSFFSGSNRCIQAQIAIHWVWDLGLRVAGVGLQGYMVQKSAVCIGHVLQLPRRSIV